MVTTYFLNCIMGNVFGSKTNPSLPSTMYIGLSSSTPGVDGSGVTEPAGGNYTRVLFKNLSEPSDGSISNAQDIEFPESTSDWGVITYYVIYDAKDGGHLLAYGSLEKAKIIQSETQARFLSGKITISLQNSAT